MLEPPDSKAHCSSWREGKVILERPEGGTGKSALMNKSSCGRNPDKSEKIHPFIGSVTLSVATCVSTMPAVLFGGETIKEDHTKTNVWSEQA